MTPEQEAAIEAAAERTAERIRAEAGPLASLPLSERVRRYSAVGRSLVAGTSTVGEAAEALRKEAA